MKVKSFFTQNKLTKMAASEKLISIGGINVDIWYSEYWIKIKKYNIPKNYILGTYTYAPSGTRSHFIVRIYFYLITNEEIFIDFEYNNNFEIDQLIKCLRVILPNALVLDSKLVCHWTYDKDNQRKMLQAVAEQLKDDHDWYTYIYEKPQNFIDLLAGKHVKKSNYYKTDDSDLYFKEFF